MMQIIPAINATDFKEVKKKIKLVERYVKWVHLDVADGTFTENTLWHDARDLVGLKTKLNIEVHLMVVNPEERALEWLFHPVKRILVHHETIDDIDLIVEKCREAQVETGVAIAPESDWTALESYIGTVNFFQILAVKPGHAGQEFLEENYEKIKQLRRICTGCDIEVDGGVKMGVAEKCVAAGANILVAASAIFGDKDIKRAIDMLKEDCV